MDAIYSTTALRDRQREVKAEARKRLVRITENGNAAFIFCSDEIFEREIQEAVERELYRMRVAECIKKGGEAFEQGDYVVGIEAAKKAVAELKDPHD